jgi:RNA polymerase sigma factor (TIGR02999 family)
VHDSTEITSLLEAWKSGDHSVEAALAVYIYPIMRELARGHVRRSGGVMTLAATELAHEAYERLHQQQKVDWKSRDHFLAIAATLVRRVVVDHLRRRSAEKRGGDAVCVELGSPAAAELVQPTDGIDWLALDQALTRLGQIDPDCARVVELRLFSGQTVSQIASVLGSSTATVGRQWRFARVWLSEQLDGGAADPHG